MLDWLKTNTELAREIIGIREGYRYKCHFSNDAGFDGAQIISNRIALNQCIDGYIVTTDKNIFDYAFKKFEELWDTDDPITIEIGDYTDNFDFDGFYVLGFFTYHSFLDQVLSVFSVINKNFGKGYVELVNYVAGFYTDNKVLDMISNFLNIEISSIEAYEICKTSSNAHIVCECKAERIDTYSTDNSVINEHPEHYDRFAFI